MIALALRYWWAVVIAALLLALGAQTMRINAAHTRMAEHLAQDAADREAAITAARTEETRRQAAQDEEAARARTENIEREAAVAALADTGDRLRDELAGFKRRAASACAAPAQRGQGEPGASALDLLANVYQRSAEERRAVAEYAERVYGAGIACERSADAVSGGVVGH